MNQLYDIIFFFFLFTTHISVFFAKSFTIFKDYT